MPTHRVNLAAIAESPVDAINHMTLELMAAPDPHTLTLRDVIIAIESAQVGWVDLLMTSGMYQHAPKPPYTPGLEYAGKITWMGADVPKTTLAVGDPVLVDGFTAGPRSLGGYQPFGGFASYGVAPFDAVHRVPELLSMDQACCLLGNYETAFHGLVARGKVAKGETVLILGASGSTGLAAVQLAKLLGATVIATGRSEEKLAIVKEQGADHVIAKSAFREDVKAITGGRGVDVVWDGVGGDVSLEALRCVKFGARFLVIGWASTPFVAKEKPNALPTNLIMMKGLDVLGCPTVISTVMNPALRTSRLAQVLSWAEKGEIRPYVSRTYPLAEFKDAMRAKWNGEIVGGCVLHP